MEFHTKWRRDLFDMLERDPQHHLGQGQYELARVIDEECTEFPDPTVLATYLLPLMPWSDGGQPPVTEVTSRQPDLAALSAFCSRTMGWPLDSLWPRLMEARVGAVVCALLQVRTYFVSISHSTIPTLSLFQLPGGVNSLALQQGIHVVSYHNRSLPVYKISMPTHLLLALPTDAAPSSSDMHMSSPCNYSSYEMEIPAVVLDSLWPDLAHSFQSTGMEPVDEDMRSTPEEAVIDLTMEEPYDVKVIDLTGED